jgi:prepilin-type N-terminal cleavage/methylation domain-containing protein
MCAGFGLIELLASMTILSVFLLALTTTSVNSYKAERRTHATIIAQKVASTLIESIIAKGRVNISASDNYQRWIEPYPSFAFEESLKITDINDKTAKIEVSINPVNEDRVSAVTLTKIIFSS